MKNNKLNNSILYLQTTQFVFCRCHISVSYSCVIRHIYIHKQICESTKYKTRHGCYKNFHQFYVELELEVTISINMNLHRKDNVFWSRILQKQTLCVGNVDQFLESFNILSVCLCSVNNVKNTHGITTNCITIWWFSNVIINNHLCCCLARATSKESVQTIVLIAGPISVGDFGVQTFFDILVSLRCLPSLASGITTKYLQIEATQKLNS